MFGIEHNDPIPTHLSAERATVFCAEKEDRKCDSIFRIPFRLFC
jgi:hypothetical protein